MQNMQLYFVKVFPMSKTTLKSNLLKFFTSHSYLFLLKSLAVFLKKISWSSELSITSL